MRRSGMFRNARNRRGFTLIELLIVIGIIGLLVTVLAVSLLAFLPSAKVKATMSLLNTLGGAVAGERTPPDPTGKRLKKDAGALHGRMDTRDQVLLSSQVLAFYLCPSPEIWDQAPVHQKKGAYNPTLKPEQIKDSLRDDKSMQYIVDAWDSTIWYYLDPSGTVYLLSAGEDGKFETDDDLIYDGGSNSVYERADKK